MKITKHMTVDYLVLYHDGSNVMTCLNVVFYWDGLNSCRYEIRVSIESGAIQKIWQFMAISPIGKQRSHPWNVSTNEGAVTRKYDNSWPSNQGFSNFLFEHKVFITFQLVNFILNQIGSLVFKSRNSPAAEHIKLKILYFKISPRCPSRPKYRSLLKVNYSFDVLYQYHYMTLRDKLILYRSQDCYSHLRE